MAGDYIITKSSDITDILIPFFDKYKIEGYKYNNYIIYILLLYLSFILYNNYKLLLKFNNI